MLSLDKGDGKIYTLNSPHIIPFLVVILGWAQRRKYSRGNCNPLVTFYKINFFDNISL